MYVQGFDFTVHYAEREKVVLLQLLDENGKEFAHIILDPEKTKKLIKGLEGSLAAIDKLREAK